MFCVHCREKQIQLRSIREKHCLHKKYYSSFVSFLKNGLNVKVVNHWFRLISFVKCLTRHIFRLILLVIRIMIRLPVAIIIRFSTFNIVSLIFLSMMITHLPKFTFIFSLCLNLVTYNRIMLTIPLDSVDLFIFPSAHEWISKKLLST